MKNARRQLRISQGKLAVLSGVGRFIIWAAENGERPLTREEEAKIRAALETEANRLRGLALTWDSAAAETQDLMPAA